MRAMPSVISVSNVSKTYVSGLQALKGVNLEIERGEIFALLGPNGAGKTTLIGIICGTVNATEGTVRADGFDIVRLRKVRRLYSLDDIRAEIAEVRTGLQRCMTLAAECSDPATLAAFVRRLGFSPGENTSYPEFVAGIATAGNPEADSSSPG